MKLGLMISSLLYFVIVILIQNHGSCEGCLENERIGLLDIKHYIISLKDDDDPDFENYIDDELVSWVDDRSSNCCGWNRVKCSNISSGHITELSLRDLLYLPLSSNGTLNASLFRPYEELQLLDLSNIGLQSWFGNKDFLRLKKLDTLDLSSNEINSSFLSNLNGLPALINLNLGSNFMGYLSLQGFSGQKKLETLDLSYNRLNSNTFPNLKGLTALTALNLGNNEIDNNFSPQGFPKLKKLETLDLSYNGLKGDVLSKLNGLTALKALNLSSNSMHYNFSTQGFLRSEELEVLDLSRNRLNCYIMKRLLQFTSLRSLKLVDNKLNCSLSALGLARLTRLEQLNLSGNQLTNSLQVEDVQNWKNLKMLNLRDNSMTGSIKGLCKLRDLVELDISYNMFSTQLPECLSNLTNLKVLNLGNNVFSGNFPSFISNLTSLTYLSLYASCMKGSFLMSSLANHSKLQELYISSQSIGAHIETENIKWFPKFQLKYLVIRNCNLNMDKGNVIPSFLSYQSNLILIDMSSNKLVGSFPSWLQNNDGIQYLDISNNNLSGWLPKDIGIFLPNVTFLKLSWNKFEGNIPSSSGKMKKLQWLDFSHNTFTGDLPKDLATECNNLRYLKLSNNFLQGNIPKHSNWMNMNVLFLNNNNFSGTLNDLLGINTELGVLDISNNSISGIIPSSIGVFSKMQVLLMAENLLEGYIPLEMSNMTSLEILDLSQNKLIGSFLNFSSVYNLEYLYLQNNNLSGSIPFEISGSSNMKLLDLSENKFSGKIPNWMDTLSNLRVLLLGGNNLEGDIPISLCQLKKMDIMDLSRNMLNGSIPSCFQNLSFGIGQYDNVREMYLDEDPDFQFSLYFLLQDSISSELLLFIFYDIKTTPPLFGLLNEDLTLEVGFRTKNNYYFYTGKILENMTGLDLSCNKLTGTIPVQIGNLQQIRALNLSHNYLSGPIPITFSNLTQIESLDLSYNNLSGKIPGELTQLNFLSNFNVSYNNFSGTPPNTGQFGDFDEENYRGNPGLCGPLLDRKCDSVASSPSPQPHDSGEKESKVDMISFYWSFAASYITILLSIITVLYINENWRMAWFYFISKTIRKRFPNFPKLY